MTGAPPAGVPLRDHDVRLDVTPEQAVAASRSQRTRLLETVGTLRPEQWAAPSRCSEWTVQDVVRHLGHVNHMQLAAIAAARAGERFAGFAAGSFDPKVTPAALLAEEGPQTAEQTLSTFRSSTAELLDVIDALGAVDTGDGELLVSTPAGRQPWHRALLHGLFDSAVHERDITRPVGLPDPQPPAEETRAIATYQVLLTGRVLAVVGAPVDLGLTLHGGPSLRVRVDGALVSVTSEGVLGAPVAASGEVAAVLDGMVGRGALADALDGPPQVALGLSALAALV